MSKPTDEEAPRSIDDVVLIRWVDSCSFTEWHRREKAEYELATCTTVGFVVDDNETAITLVQNTTSFGQLSNTITIPKACVVFRTKVHNVET